MSLYARGMRGILVALALGIAACSPTPALSPEPAADVRCTLRVGERPPVVFEPSLDAGTVVEDTAHGVPYRVEVVDGDAREFLARVGSDELGATSEVRITMPDEFAAGTLVVALEGVTLPATGRPVALSCVGADG